MQAAVVAGVGSVAVAEIFAGQGEQRIGQIKLRRRRLAAGEVQASDPWPAGRRSCGSAAHAVSAVRQGQGTETTPRAFHQRQDPRKEGTPRTRQSPLTLAAFRPWGSSQDRRRAGSVASVIPGRRATRRAHQAGRLPWPAEDSPSGLWRSPGTRVGLTALAGSNPASSALGPGCVQLADSLVAPRPMSIEEGYGPHRCGGLARVVLYRRRCPLLLLRIAALARAARRHLPHSRHGAAHCHRRPDRPRRAAGGVHAAAHPPT